ncbi:hypothetical protein SKAU_G00128760 [Synaphobranchus kaupii]|uniref:Uncharacterized protein n=1 Tax=Synaphobranchus kaupii TaxID=118154 RepID=A0A9Q1FPZ3_SYNKA|nr:hypothetical protein SKAU_G00128760 [Synaphobranchus kaupii]
MAFHACGVFRDERRGEPITDDAFSAASRTKADGERRGPKNRRHDTGRVKKRGPRSAPSGEASAAASDAQSRRVRGKPQLVC